MFLQSKQILKRVVNFTDVTEMQKTKIIFNI